MVCVRAQENRCAESLKTRGCERIGSSCRDELKTHPTVATELLYPIEHTWRVCGPACKCCKGGKGKTSGILRLPIKARTRCLGASENVVIGRQHASQESSESVQWMGVAVRVSQRCGGYDNAEVRDGVLLPAGSGAARLDAVYGRFGLSIPSLRTLECEEYSAGRQYIERCERTFHRSGCQLA